MDKGAFCRLGIPPVYYHEPISYISNMDEIDEWDHKWNESKITWKLESIVVHLVNYDFIIVIFCNNTILF